MFGFLNKLVDKATDRFWGDTFKLDLRPQDMGQGGARRPAPGDPLATGPGTTPQAGENFSHFAEGSSNPSQQAEQQQQRQEQANQHLPPQPDAAARRETEQLERNALDPSKPVSAGELEQLKQNADPQHMKPEEVLRQRGVPAEAVDTLRNAAGLDAQATAAVGDPDIKDQAALDASHQGRTAMTDEQKRQAVQAQAALSEDMQVDAEVRKAVDFDKAGQLLAGGGPNPAMYGDFGLRRNTEGQTSKEVVATLGLDYQGSKFVKDGADGKKTFADDISTLGTFVIDTEMTADMKKHAQVPLGHDVMEEAEAQAQALAEAKKTDPSVHIPPMLELNPDGTMAHAFERNRASAVDPRTGLGNSTVQHPELLAEAEAQRPGEQVNVVNQEMKLKQASPLPVGNDAQGDPRTQMNLVRPDGTVVNVATLVPVTTPEGQPIYEKDKDGKTLMVDGQPVPKTRWALNEGMAPEVKDQVFSKVDEQDRAARTAWEKRRDELTAAGKASEIPDPPAANPELERWRAQQAASRSGAAS